MFYQLPPVGNPICLSVRSGVSGLSISTAYQIQFYASGTAALAAAIVASIKHTGNNSPEIILPAYGCPDLISAVVYSGAKPVLVDIEIDRPWLDLSQLSAAITENTAAIIAVDLFGVAERWSQLREQVAQQNIVLIEDSAQYFPVEDRQPEWQGDMVVLSFGRGKPVSLLGGGAVLTKKTALLEHLPKPMGDTSRSVQRLSFAIKASLYNAMISPYIYWLPHAMPFLHLGETRYHALVEIAAMDQVRLELLEGNIRSYQADAGAMTRGKEISSMLESLTMVQDLPRLCNTEMNRRLLRYPLLLDSAARDSVYQKLTRAGLGASIMYPASLPNIAGLQDVLDVGQRFPNAEMFASRLLTLPVHARVSEKDIQKMYTVLKDKPNTAPD